MKCPFCNNPNIVKFEYAQKLEKMGEKIPEKIREIEKTVKFEDEIRKIREDLEGLKKRN